MTRLAYAHAKAAGLALEPLLKKAALSQAQIDNPRTPIKVRDQIRFLNLVADALEDDLLGFHLAQTPDLREAGLLFYVLASSDTFAEVLQRGARYSSIVNEGISPRVIDGKSVGLSFHYVGVSRHLDRHQIEFWMTAFVRICRQLTGLRLVPGGVRFTHRRAQNAEFAEFFGDNVEFGAADDDIVFAGSCRQLPVVSADPYLSNLLISYCEEALSRKRANRSGFRSAVENAVAPVLPHGKTRVGEIARQLGVSQRTFARRLSLEGLTFSEVLDELRSDLANRYLAERELPISQIAWLLGYREIGAFSHAYKRWTGKTPREARSRQAPPPAAEGGPPTLS